MVSAVDVQVGVPVGSWSTLGRLSLLQASYSPEARQDQGGSRLTCRVGPQVHRYRVHKRPVCQKSVELFAEIRAYGVWGRVYLVYQFGSTIYDVDDVFDVMAGAIDVR